MTIKRGLLFGKFAPLTKGHMSMIEHAAKKVSKLYLFLSYDQKFVDAQPEWIQPKLDLLSRLRDLKTFVDTYGIENIEVDFVDESNIPGYPEGGKAFADLIRAKQPFVKFDVAFSSEPEYGEYFAKYFPEAKHYVVDAERKKVNISATRVRENLRDNIQFINPYGRGRFVKRVAIVGVESTGKTTLTDKLAKHYVTRWTPEVGRIICEEEFHSSEFLMSRDDYLRVARKHREAEDEMTEFTVTPVVFSDTTNLITHFSAICADKAGVLDRTFTALSKEEGDNYYDLVLYLQPDVPWVKDPLRLQDTPQKRAETNCLLDMMIRQFYNNTKVFKIAGSDYEDRFNQAVAIVDKLLASPVFLETE